MNKEIPLMLPRFRILFIITITTTTARKKTLIKFRKQREMLIKVHDTLQPFPFSACVDFYSQVENFCNNLIVILN